jgi:hypothetical protein
MPLSLKGKPRSGRSANSLTNQIKKKIIKENLKESLMKNTDDGIGGHVASTVRKLPIPLVENYKGSSRRPRFRYEGNIITDHRKKSVVKTY